MSTFKNSHVHHGINSARMQSTPAVPEGGDIKAQLEDFMLDVFGPDSVKTSSLNFPSLIVSVYALVSFSQFSLRLSSYLHHRIATTPLFYP